MPSAHCDTFARDHLPPRDQWPELLFERPELQFPEQLNAAAVLLDQVVADGDEGGRGWGALVGRRHAASHPALYCR